MPQTTQEPFTSPHAGGVDHTAAEQEVGPVADGYENYYAKLSKEVDSLSRHAQELRETPGLEHLTEDEAQEQVTFMLRFASWVFNQYMKEQLASTSVKIDEVAS